MADEGALRFAEKVLTLLDEGVFTATYKFAVLLGLLDLSLENAGRNGEPPDTFTTHQLAEKVIELYWPHALPFGHGRSTRAVPAFGAPADRGRFDEQLDGDNMSARPGPDPAGQTHFRGLLERLGVVESA